MLSCSCKNFFVALAALASVGLVLAGPLPSSEGVKYSVESHEAPGGLLGRWNSIKEKWNLVTNTCGNLFDSVKNDWNEVKDKAKSLGKDVEEDFDKAKSDTLKLLDNAKKVYRKIIIDGEDAFDNFRAISQDIEKSIEHLKEKGGKVFDDVSGVYQAIKEDIDNEEKLIKDGNIESALKGFKRNWDNVKTHWDKLGDDFGNLCDTTISDWEKLEKDTVVTVNGVEKDLKDIKTEVTELITDIRNTYKQIVVDGKRSIDRFNELYTKIRQTFEDLKPALGDAMDAFKLLLKEFKTDAEVVASLQEEALPEETAEVFEVIEVGAVVARSRQA